MAKISEVGVRQQTITANYISAEPVTRAEFIYTLDQGVWAKRRWQHVAAEIFSDHVSATRPQQPQCAGFFNLTDRQSAVTSSEVIGPDTNVNKASQMIGVSSL